MCTWLGRIHGGGALQSEATCISSRSGALFTINRCPLLFGFPRPTLYAWHRGDREALWWPGISHPIASIDARVNVAYLASLLWHCFEGSECARRYFDFVKAQMRKTLMHPDCRRTNTEIFNRWSRDERLRWNQIFKRAT